jgi:hypothetical protein
VSRSPIECQVIEVLPNNTTKSSKMIEGIKFRIFRSGIFVWNLLSVLWRVKFVPTIYRFSFFTPLPLAAVNISHVTMQSEHFAYSSFVGHLASQVHSSYAPFLLNMCDWYALRWRCRERKVYGVSPRISRTASKKIFFTSHNIRFCWSLITRYRIFSNKNVRLRWILAPTWPGYYSCTN